MEEKVVNPEVNEPTPEQVDEQPAAIQEPEIPAEQTPAEDDSAKILEGEETATPEPQEEEPIPANEPAVDFEAQIAELQNQINELTTNYENAQNRIQELENQISSASEVESSLRATIATYEAEHNRMMVEQKNAIIEKYAAHINDDEQIASIREQMNDFSCEELESKLAICFANKQMAGSDEKVVPLPDPVVNQFALLMDKYRKN